MDQVFVLGPSWSLPLILLVGFAEIPAQQLVLCESDDAPSRTHWKASASSGRAHVEV